MDAKDTQIHSLINKLIEGIDNVLNNIINLYHFKIILTIILGKNRIQTNNINWQKTWIF